MLPPRRHTRGHWVCTTCRADLGRLHLLAGRSQALYATGIIAARKTGERTWILTCQNGHETAWTGDQLNWWNIQRAA